MAAPATYAGQPPQINLGFRRLNPRLYTSMAGFNNNKFQQLSTPCSILRLRNALRLQAREKFGRVVFASSKSGVSTGGNSPKDESGEIEDGKSGQSPPFLTILAGFLVLSVVVWIIKSIIMGLIGLFK